LGPDTTLCDVSARLSLNLTGLAETYEWQDGSSGSSYLTSQSEQIYVAASNGRCSTRDTLQVTYLPALPLDLGPDIEVCEGDLVNLHPNLTSGQFIWQENTRADSFLVTQPGFYQVRLDSSGCSFRDTIQVSFKASPAVNLGPNQDFCEGDRISISNLDHTAGINYIWSDNFSTQERLIDTEGLYILTGERNGCTSQDSILISRLETPSLNIGEDTTVCDGQSLQIQAESNASNFSIRWQDGSTEDQLIVQSAGIYTATITANGCQNQDSIRVNYQNLPIFDLGMDLTICEGEQTQLQASGDLEGTVFNWQDGISGSQRIVTEANTYLLFAERQGCTYQDSVQLIVNPLPEIALGEDTTICTGEPVLLGTTVDISNVQYLWQDNSEQAQLLIEAAGSYSLTVTKNECSASDTIEVFINPLPIFELGPDQSICENEAIQINPNLPQNASAEWQDNKQAPVNRSLTQSGLYTLVASLGRCTYSDSLTLNVLETPQPNLGGDRILCEGESVQLEPNIEGNYIWEDASNSDRRTITEPGLYWVEVSRSSCTGRDSVRIDFQLSPQIDLGPDQQLCKGESVFLDARQAEVDYLWNDGSDQPTRRISTSGQYWVELEKNGCLAADTVQIQFIDPPSFDLGPDTTICGEGDILTVAVPDFA
ncbi:MAG: hypothetical protein AAF242_18065, partial [Bacteroidota bacterium]